MTVRDGWDGGDVPPDLGMLVLGALPGHQRVETGPAREIVHCECVQQPHLPGHCHLLAGDLWTVSYILAVIRTSCHGSGCSRNQTTDVRQQFEPWHLITSFVQYLLMAPSFINVLNVYAFANVQ